MVATGDSLSRSLHKVMCARTFRPTQAFGTVNALANATGGVKGEHGEVVRLY
jgi:hypothetical protein